VSARRKSESTKPRRATFRALAVRNFRLWIVGALIANIGSWAQRTAQDWLVLTELTNNDAVAVGISLSLQFGPILVLGPFVGPLVDRVSGRAIILTTTIVELTLGLVLGVAVVMGVATLPLVYALALGLGISQAFEAPARMAFVSELVGTGNIPNAIGMNSMMFNTSRLVGPAIAGLSITTLGTGWTLTISAACYAAAVVAIALLRRTEFHPVSKVAKAKGQFGEGLAYIRSRPDIIVVLVMALIVGALVFNFGIFSATMAVVEFGLGAHDYGFMTSALAVGSIAGALLVARSRRPRLSVIVVAALTIAVGAGLAAVAPTVTMFIVLYPILGLGAILMVATSNSYLQVSTDDKFRGRVMAIFSTVVIGGTPLGSPLTGFVANNFGPRWAVGVAAVGGLLAAIIGLLWMRTSHNISSGETIRSAFRHTPSDEDTATQLITLTHRAP
jgi:MFS family permease